MCLIVNKPANISPDITFYEDVVKCNKDGWGIMYNDPNKSKVIVEKGLEFKEFLTTITPLHDTEVLIHFRKATVGEVNVDNLHPIPLVNGAFLMHNGTIKKIDIPEGSTSSDSLILADMLNSLILAHGEKILWDEIFQEIIKGYIDSRIIILFPDGKRLVVTNYMWYEYEEQGVMVSNLYAWEMWKSAENFLIPGKPSASIFSPPTYLDPAPAPQEI